MAINATKLKKALTRPGARMAAPTREQAQYFRALDNLTRAAARALEDIVFPVVERLASEASAMDTADPLVAAFEKFLKKVAGLKQAEIARNVFKQTADGTMKFHKARFVQNANKAVGVDVRVLLDDDKLRPVVDAALKENADLIKSIGSSYKERADAIIKQGLTSGRNFNSIRAKLLKLGGFTDQYAGTETRRAKLIARDQTQKFFNSIDKARQKQVGVTHYWWDTAGDSRVRQTHKDNDGKRFAWNKPPKTGHPGHDVQCRCVAVPDLTHLVREGT